MASYTWKIDDPSLVKEIKTASINGDCFYSNVFSMFGMRWQLEMRPNRKCPNAKDKTQTLIYLNLRAMSPKIKCARFQVTRSLLPGDVKNRMDYSLTHEQMFAMAWAEEYGILAQEVIEKYDEYTVKFDVELLAVYNQNDDEITQQFLKKDDIKMDGNVSLHEVLAMVENQNMAIQKIHSRMDQIETKLNDEQKENSMNLVMDVVMNEIQSLKEEISKLIAKKNQNPKTTELRAWLEDKVGCPQYFELFAENGIEDLSTAKLLTMEALKAIGIDKIGHCMKILHQVAALNQNNNDEEGGTQFV